ncbi:prolyl oligopeptidase family serine peptidase [bacterium]|nr:prolyl oligopeptidase family serine peptidase [bacterium]
MSQGALPELLMPYQAPPASFEVDPSAYRSPLSFEDETPVESPKDWQRRRVEIKASWMQVMGPWPDLIEDNVLDLGEAQDLGAFIQQRVYLNIAHNQRAAGWLMLPKGKGPFPSALVVFYDPETSIGLKADKPGRDFGRQLVREGIATLNIGTPGGNAWKPEIGEAQCQPLSFHAYVAANAWFAMANHPQLDASRIGVVGHSYGGKWAMFAAALWDRFAAVAVSDPGIVFDESRSNVNYWEPWYLGLDPENPKPKSGIPSLKNPRTGSYRKMNEKGMDLHEIHALVAPRPFLISGGSEDPIERWNSLHHLIEINRVLGHEHKVFFTQRKNHGPTPESNAQLLAFFTHFLKP